MSEIRHYYFSRHFQSTLISSVHYSSSFELCQPRHFTNQYQPTYCISIRNPLGFVFMLIFTALLLQFSQKVEISVSQPLFLFLLVSRGVFRSFFGLLYTQVCRQTFFTKLACHELKKVEKYFFRLIDVIDLIYFISIQKLLFCSFKRV